MKRKRKRLCGGEEAVFERAYEKGKKWRTTTYWNVRDVISQMWNIFEDITCGASNDLRL